MRRLRLSVSTSPARTVWAGLSTRTRLSRTLPAATMSAANVRVFTKRANHNHLSRRCVPGAVRRLVCPAGAQVLVSLPRLASSSRSAPRAANGESGSTPPRRGGAAVCTSALRRGSSRRSSRRGRRSVCGCRVDAGRFAIAVTLATALPAVRTPILLAIGLLLARRHGRLVARRRAGAAAASG